jgi:hypothetical protein
MRSLGWRKALLVLPSEGEASSRGAANRPRDDRDRHVVTVTDREQATAGPPAAELPVFNDGSRSSKVPHSGRRGGVSAWHARGQGFKSPQLHQPQRVLRSRSWRRLPEICQRITKRARESTLSVDRIGRFWGALRPRLRPIRLGRGRHPTVRRGLDLTVRRRRPARRHTYPGRPADAVQELIRIRVGSCSPLASTSTRIASLTWTSRKAHTRTALLS